MLGRWVPSSRRPLRATREYQFARHLARNHRLTLGFITDNPNAGGPISTLRAEFGDLEFAMVPRGWKSLASAIRLATGESCTLSYFRSEALRTRLVDCLRTTRYDVVFVSSSSMIQYALDIDGAIPLVMDFGDVDSEWWVRQAAHGTFPAKRFFKTEARRLRAAEATAAKRAARCLVAAAEAGEVVQSFSPGTPVLVIPNGVDVEFYAPESRPAKEPTVILNTSLANKGAIRDLVEFNREVMTTVRARHPRARFVVVSTEAPPAGRPISDLAGIQLAAPVADVRSLLHRATVAVAPLRAGSDVQRSILVPMAAGLPVVATSQAARLASGMNSELLVADSPQDLALYVIRLLENPSLVAEVGAHARAFVAANHDWSVTTVRLTEIIADVVKRAPTAGAPEREPVLQVRP